MSLVRPSRHTARPPKRRGLRALGHAANGSTIVEFAMIAAPLIALLIAIIQTSLTFFTQQVLESTVERSGRQILTGAVQKKNLSKADFRNVVCATLPAYLKCGNVLIDVQTASSFSTADLSPLTIQFDSTGKPINNTAYNPGNPGDIVVMKVLYLWSVAPGPLGFDLSTLSTGQRLLIATAVFKTEPYQ
jgi:Flp pilus assembly protein TadG